jgi:hypothetical protein
VCQLRPHHLQRRAEVRLLAHMAAVEDGRMGLVDAETLDTVEAEGEAAGLMIEDSVEAYRQENGEEAKHHQSASLGLAEEEVEGMVGTGAVEEEGDGSWSHHIRFHDTSLSIFGTLYESIQMILDMS